MLFNGNRFRHTASSVHAVFLMGFIVFFSWFYCCFFKGFLKKQVGLFGSGFLQQPWP